jgi:hypothetical protein
MISYSGADPGFQVRGGGGPLKKLRRTEGGLKFFGVFRVKNHDFTPKNHIFSNFRGGGAPEIIANCLCLFTHGGVDIDFCCSFLIVSLVVTHSSSPLLM